MGRRCLHTLYYEIFTYCAFSAFDMGLCSLPFNLSEFSILVFSLSTVGRNFHWLYLICSVRKVGWCCLHTLFFMCYEIFTNCTFSAFEMGYLLYLPFYFIGIFPSGNFFIYGGIFPDLTCFVQPPRWAGAVHPHDGDSEPGAAHPGPGHRGLPLLLLQQRLWTGPTTALCLLRDEVGCCLLIF